MPSRPTPPSSRPVRRACAPSRPAASPQTGFTLVELLIVVLILAILAAIVVPSMTSSADEARRGRFCDSLRTFVTAAQWATEKNGEPIEDASSGELPAELAGLVKASSWEAATPLGGVWDSERDSFGVVSAVGVHYLNGGDPGDEEFLQVDALMDDGDLATGGFRKLGAGRYYFVVLD